MMFMINITNFIRMVSLIILSHDWNLYIEIATFPLCTVGPSCSKAG